MLGLFLVKKVGTAAIPEKDKEEHISSQEQEKSSTTEEDAQRINSMQIKIHKGKGAPSRKKGARSQ